MPILAAGTRDRTWPPITPFVLVLVLAVACSGQASSSPAPSPSASASSTTSPSPAPSPSASAYDSSARQTAKPAGSVEGAPLGYVEYLPPTYAGQERHPLLIFHHALDRTGDGSEEALRRLLEAGVPKLIAEDRWPEDRPFIVLSPQHEWTPTEPCQTAPEVDAFLDFAVPEYGVDPARIYLTGTSCGANGVWAYLARQTDEVVSAAVLIAGDGRPAFAESGCDLGRVAIWALHGQNDPRIEPNGSIDPIRALNSCTDPRPIDARLTMIDGGHDIWDPIYAGEDEDIYAWLLGHRKSS